MRTEEDSNIAVYDIHEAFPTMRLGVEFSKLHIRTCVNPLKYVSNMDFMERSDQEVEGSGLGSDYLRQDSFNFCLVILM